VHVAHDQVGLEVGEQRQVGVYGALALVAPPAQAAQAGALGQLHGDVAVYGVYRAHLEAGVAGDVHVGAVAAEDHAVAEVALEGAAHLEAAGDVGEKATVGEHGDCRHGALPKQ